ncbi:hypothetical protein NP233_g5877 [Leucocoprinus birnbaumii]|uniref:DUF6533 domain-containing protein n=1 Tax=Leucocoprinus birnbaumii TaxID=56174 RepID=A0AAD5YWA1_9AGAR|nr:hypothetical protein NP233_g5877 [Leucocoprinus birnbaumii]
MSNTTDSYGLGIADIVDDIILTSQHTYAQAPAVSLLVYDSICLMPYEVKYIYQGKWSRTQGLYFLIRLCTWCHTIINFYINTHAFNSRMIAVNAILPVVLRFLLAMRIRAVWNNSYIVTVVLYTLVLMEGLIGVTAAILTIYSSMVSAVGDVPLHGCLYSNEFDTMGSISTRVTGTFVAYGLFASTTAIGLTVVPFMRYYRMLKLTGPAPLERISHMRLVTPLLYVFYRDGTLLLIPVWILSLLEVFEIFSFNFAANDLSVWLSVGYGMVGARLILNIRAAGCDLGETLLSRPLNSFTPSFGHRALTARDEDD